MANPNIVNVTTIYGGLSTLAVGTSASNIVQNTTGSNSIYKINSLTVTNANTGSVTVTVEVNQAGTITAFAKSLNVLPGTAQIIIGKDNGIYLLENNSLQLSASLGSSITAVCSYEQIS